MDQVKIAVLVSMVLISACSHGPYSVEPQEDFFTQIPIKPELMVFKTKRQTASLEQWLKEAEDKNKPSLKRIYFRAFYAQNIELMNLLGKEKKTFSCPQFHHDKLIVDEKFYNLEKLNLKQAAYPQNHDLSLYPEWTLSMKHQGKRMDAYEWGQKKKLAPGLALKKAYKAYSHKREKELEELCESGFSENYFKFENLVTYFSNKENYFNTVGGLKALFKIPLFAHMMIGQSVKNDPVLSLSIFEREALDRSMAWQVEEYIVQLNQQKFQLAQVKK